MNTDSIESPLLPDFNHAVVVGQDNAEVVQSLCARTKTQCREDLFLSGPMDDLLIGGLDRVFSTRKALLKSLKEKGVNPKTFEELQNHQATPRLFVFIQNAKITDGDLDEKDSMGKVLLTALMAGKQYGITVILGTDRFSTLPNPVRVHLPTIID